MEGKHIAWIVCIIAISLSAGVMVDNLTKPRLTDPVAQRIWAATHGNIILNGEEASKLVKDATYADSVTRKK